MCKYLYYCSIIKCKSLLLLMSDTTISAGLHWLCPEKPDSDQISHIFVSIVSLTDNLLTFYLNSDPYNHWCKPDLFSQMLLPAEHIYFYHTPTHPDQTCLGLSVEYVWICSFAPAEVCDCCSFVPLTCQKWPPHFQLLKYPPQPWKSY